MAESVLNYGIETDASLLRDFLSLFVYAGREFNDHSDFATGLLVRRPAWIPVYLSTVVQIVVDGLLKRGFQLVDGTAFKVDIIVGIAKMTVKDPVLFVIMNNCRVSSISHLNLIDSAQSHASSESAARP